MSYWLLKSEPSKWSWIQQVEAGEAGTFWDGVRNPLALLYMREMKVGDEAFFYHSNEGREIVGVVRILKPFYPDLTDLHQKRGMVDVAFSQNLRRPVTLKEIKADQSLSQMKLVTHSRLSVQPVTPVEWERVLMLSEKRK